MYAIVYEYAYDGTKGMCVIASPSEEEAKQELKRIKEFEERIADKYGYEVFEDNETYYEAGTPSDYRNNFVKCRIRKIINT